MTYDTWRLWAAVPMALATALLVWAFRASHVSDDCLDLGSTASFPDNSVSFVPCVPAFVVHGIDTDFAVYLADQRNGKELHWDERRHVFSSEDGRKTYNVQGEPLAEAPGRALVRCQIRIDSGRLLLISSRDLLRTQTGAICSPGGGLGRGA